MTEEFRNIGIEPKGSYQSQKLVCPKCSPSRKNKTDKCLSIDLVEGVYNCHHCGWHGSVKKRNMYEKPDKTKRNFTKLSDEGLSVFTSRGISQSTVIECKIVEERGNLVFPYMRNKELVNFKVRDIKQKRFMQAKNAEPIMWNYDLCLNSKDIIVCEGEFDAMSFIEAGYKYATTVNQGAPNAADKNIDKKLECITNSYELFDGAENIYIAVDKDDNGKRLEKELIRRFGWDKCLIVSFPEGCKDANDVLCTPSLGKKALVESIESAKEVGVEGSFGVDDFEDLMLSEYRNGKVEGVSTGCYEIDSTWRWRFTEVNLLTGYANEGKSAVDKWLKVMSSVLYGWNHAFFSPEEMPPNEFFDTLIEIYAGGSVNKTDKHSYINEARYLEARDFVKRHCFVAQPEEYSLDAVLDVMRFFVKKKGVRTVTLDPYNSLRYDSGATRDDLHIGRFMDVLKKFAVETEVALTLVAHQTTPQKGDNGLFPKPSIYRIKGGGTFADKADNVLTYYRPNRAIDFRDSSFEFESQKIKRQRLVAIPSMTMGQYDRDTSRFLFNGVDYLERAKKSMTEQLEIPSENDEWQGEF